MENEVDVTILPGTLDLVAWLVSLVPVIFLLLWDVWKAWKRRAFWIPGQALVLSALIIQLLSFIDYSHIRLYSGSRYQTKEVVAILVKNQLVIDSGRLMLCVLIAYLLPGMVRSGSITDGSNLAAPALSVTFHVVSELRSISKVEKRNESLSAPAALSDGIFSVVCSTTLIATIIYLLLLLIRAVMIGRTIRRFISQKIPLAISCCCTPCDRPRCNDMKDHVLKCWIVARLSQPDYVLARSGLSSMALPIVTACIVVYVINWGYVLFTDHESLNSLTKTTLVQFVIIGQLLIVLIGWIVVLVRGVTSLMHGDIFSGDYFKSMSIQDALTDLIPYFIRLFVWDKRIREKTIREMNKKIRDISSSLCYPRHLVQKLSQFLSRIDDDDQFPRYNETLSMLLIPGESALRLWKANQWGFRKVERYMEPDQKDGKCSRSELTDLLGLETGTADREKAKHLQQANKNSWKRTAVSLIHLMIYYYNDSDASVIEKAMQCYIQGWEYMNFVDGLNEEVKSLGRQADEEFDNLQHSWNKRAQRGMLEREIKRPLRDQLESCSNKEPRYLQNSRDSTEVAKYCLLATWTVMDLSAKIQAKIHELQCELANVYFLCMKEGLKEAVLQKCSKLAEEGREEEILDVAFLSAKAQRVLDKVREQASTSSHIQVGDNSLSLSFQSAVRRLREIAVVGKGYSLASLPPKRGGVKVRMLESLRRPNDSLTNQTEISADAGEDDSTDDSFFFENPLASTSSTIQTEDEEAGGGRGGPTEDPHSPTTLNDLFSWGSEEDNTWLLETESDEDDSSYPGYKSK